MNSKLVIFTDLDGTLLDINTHQPGPSLKYIELCRTREVPLVFVSAKTKAEIEAIRTELQNDSPFVAENGGCFFIPVEKFPADVFQNFTDLADEGIWRAWRSEVSISQLQAGLDKAVSRAGVSIKNFGRMTVEEVSRLTGLDLLRARRAKMREHDEPFVIPDRDWPKLDSLIAEIERLGYRYAFGGYLHHITGDFDKGKAIAELKKLYSALDPDTKYAGLGDSANDLPFLKQVDFPFLVRKPDNSFIEKIVFPGLTITKGIGPAGFAEAVEYLLNR